MNATIKYYQIIAKEKGLGAIPYLAIPKCRRVVWAGTAAGGVGGGGGGRNRRRCGMWLAALAASTELKIALEVAHPLGTMVRWGGSSRMGREGGRQAAHGASPLFYYSKIGDFTLAVLISQQGRALEKNWRC